MTALLHINCRFCGKGVTQLLAVLWIPSLLRRSCWPAAGSGKLQGRAGAAGRAEDAHEQIFILSDSSRVLALAPRTVEGKPRARGSPFNFPLSTLVLMVILTRLSLCFRLAGAAVVSICLLDGGAGAQGKLDGRYVATLAGVPIGEGAWVIDIGENQFTAAASGMTAGLLRVFAAGQGNAASRGAVRGGALVPTLFVATMNNDKWVEELPGQSGGNTYAKRDQEAGEAPEARTGRSTGSSAAQSVENADRLGFSVELIDISSPPVGIDTALHCCVTGARREESSRGVIARREEAECCRLWERHSSRPFNSISRFAARKEGNNDDRRDCGAQFNLRSRTG
jgi:hypothetical protein